jgi:pyruvate/2-oxoglutarate dehydrogenase complex dihydrolipoamide acyltransferase (E2) component
LTGIALAAASASAQQVAAPAGEAPERTSATQQSLKMHGYDLLSEHERSTYRTQMSAAKTEQERERVRSEHRELVQRRAKERGVDVRGMAYGPGSGAGPGKGGAGKER